MKRLLWAIPLLLLLGLWASTSPDGLQWMAARLGLAEAPPLVSDAPMPDYRIGGRWSLIAGLLGCLLVYALALALQRLVRAGRASQPLSGERPREEPEGEEDRSV